MQHVNGFYASPFRNFCLISDMVSDRDWIGRGTGIQPDLSLKDRRERGPRREGGQQEMAARIFDHRCFSP